MASACWPRPGEGSCKEFPKLVAKEQKYFTDYPLPKFLSHCSKSQTPRQAAALSSHPWCTIWRENPFLSPRATFPAGWQGDFGFLQFCFPLFKVGEALG